MSKILIPLFDMTGAACSPEDTAIFFPEGNNIYKATKEAKQLCSGCPIINDCLDFAITNKEEWGIWGGATTKERVHLSRHPNQKSVYVDELRRTKGRKNIAVITDENTVSWGDELGLGEQK